MTNVNNIFGKTNKDGNVELFEKEDGEKVTFLDKCVYPVGSSKSAMYDHPEGIVLTKIDARMLGLEIEA